MTRDVMCYNEHKKVLRIYNLYMKAVYEMSMTYFLFLFIMKPEWTLQVDIQ